MDSEKVILFFVLNKIEKLDELLHALMDAGIRGATVLTSIGMASELGMRNDEDSHVISSFRAFFVSGKSENRTIFTVIDKALIPKASEIISGVVGDLSKPNTGVLFAMPAVYVEGLGSSEKAD